MNSSEIMDAAIQLKPVDRVPNAPFYEAPICRYAGISQIESSYRKDAFPIHPIDPPAPREGTITNHRSDHFRDRL